MNNNSQLIAHIAGVTVVHSKVNKCCTYFLKVFSEFACIFCFVFDRCTSNKYFFFWKTKVGQNHELTPKHTTRRFYIFLEEFWDLPQTLRTPTCNDGPTCLEIGKKSGRRKCVSLRISFGRQEPDCSFTFMVVINLDG